MGYHTPPGAASGGGDRDALSLEKLAQAAAAKRRQPKVPVGRPSSGRPAFVSRLSGGLSDGVELVAVVAGSDGGGDGDVAALSSKPLRAPRIGSADRRPLSHKLSRQQL